METFSTLFENFTHDYKYKQSSSSIYYKLLHHNLDPTNASVSPICSSEDASGFFISLLFGLGPLLGGVFLVASSLTFHLQHALLMGVASGIAFVLGLWRPLQLLLSAKMGVIPLVSLLVLGAGLVHFISSTILSVTCRKTSRAGSIITPVTNFPTSAITLQSLLACGAIGFHALPEGLALGVAVPKAYGLGRHMVLPVSLHGLPRGTAVASCVSGATDSWHAALAAAAMIGFVGPVSAIGSILAGIDYSGLDHVMVVACGGLLPSFWQVIKRAVRLEKRKGIVGMVLGIVCAVMCLTFTKLVCLHTPYCNSAPEAVR